MTQDDLKRAVAEAALEEIDKFITPDAVIGVGTGSTANFFIDLLGTRSGDFRGAIASSEASSKRLKSHGIDVLELNHVGTVPVYVDGADEIDSQLRMIKGGGAALTREKITAACAERFICIADASKYVDVLGSFPLPIEVIPMARSYVAREMVKLGISPNYREGVVTDNGNCILDGYDLLYTDPEAMEATLDGIVGVVTNGLFAKRPADVLLLGTPNGIQRFTR